MITRREWIAMMCAAPGAAPLVRSAAAAAAPASPVSIARCASYDEDVTARLAAMFDQLGGLERLVRAKTVTIKVNMTGSPGLRVRGKAPALTHYTHPKVLGATAYLMGRAGAQRIRVARQQAEIRRFRPRGIHQTGHLPFGQRLDRQRFEPGQPIEQRPGENGGNRVGRRFEDRVGHG